MKPGISVTPITPRDMMAAAPMVPKNMHRIDFQYGMLNR